MLPSVVNAGLWVVGSQLLSSNLAFASVLTDEAGLAGALQSAVSRLRQLRDRYDQMASLAGELSAQLEEQIQPAEPAA